MTPKRWAELKEGWGLEEVPSQLTRIEDKQAEVGCCMCGSYFPGKKYSQWVGRYEYANTARSIQHAIDKLREDSYCRYHAEQMFGST